MGVEVEVVTSMHERKALMAEHMQAMRAGMAMMGAMKDGAESAPTAERQQMLEMRMDMCQSMMQMMMDRMQAPMPASK